MRAIDEPSAERRPRSDDRRCGRTRTERRRYTTSAAVHRDTVKPVTRYRRGECRRRDQRLRRVPRAGHRTGHLHQFRRGLWHRRSRRRGGRAPAPFKAYGGTKLLAEQVHRTWQAEAPGSRLLVIVRPAALFGEGKKRGNVYQLLRQIAARRFRDGWAGATTESRWSTSAACARS